MIPGMLIRVVFPIPLQKFMEIGDFVAAESATCKACGQPARQTCAQCAKAKYCSKVDSVSILTPLLTHTVGMSDGGLESVT